MLYSINMEELETNVAVTNKPWGLFCIYLHMLNLAMMSCFIE